MYKVINVTMAMCLYVSIINVMMAMCLYVLGNKCHDGDVFICI